VRRPMVMRSRATDGRSASRCLRKWPDQPLDHHSGCPRRGGRPGRQPGESAKILPKSGVIWGISVYASSQNYGRSRHQRQRETSDNHAFKGYRQEECAQLPGKTA
jgi:hypothetical protein